MESSTSTEKNNCSVESRKRLAQLGVLLKTCLFVWDAKVFWILVERKNLEHLSKIRYSGKDLAIFLGY